MPSHKDCRPLEVRSLLESSGTPFAIGDYEQREAIFSQGDTCESVMYIEKGRVRLAVAVASGKEAIVGLLGTGAFLGEEALGGHAVRRQTATAMAATEVLVVGKAQMIRVLRTQPAIADRFIAHILARNTHLEADLTDQLLSPCEQRLARTLLALAGPAEQRPCRRVLPPVSQQIIAEMVGTSRSRVNVFIAKFKKLGFIEEDDGVLQVLPSLLRVVHDGDRDASDGTFLATPPSQEIAWRARRRDWPQGGRVRE